MTRCFYSSHILLDVCPIQARKALADRQKDLEVKTQQLEIKLSNKTEEDIKKARRKSTQAGQRTQRCADVRESLNSGTGNSVSVFKIQNPCSG